MSCRDSIYRLSCLSELDVIDVRVKLGNHHNADSGTTSWAIYDMASSVRCEDLQRRIYLNQGNCNEGLSRSPYRAMVVRSGLLVRI